MSSNCSSSSFLSEPADDGFAKHHSSHGKKDKKAKKVADQSSSSSADSEPLIVTMKPSVFTEASIPHEVHQEDDLLEEDYTEDPVSQDLCELEAAQQACSEVEVCM